MLLLLIDTGLHPCDSHSPSCCHFWTTSLQNNLKSIMKVMSMATGRGKSHFNITDLLQPFFENKNLMRYPFLTIDEDHEIIIDKTSYLPACTYSEKSFSLGIQKWLDNRTIFEKSERCRWWFFTEVYGGQFSISPEEIDNKTIQDYHFIRNRIL